MPDSKNDNPKTKQNKLMSPINLPGFGYMRYEGGLSSQYTSVRTTTSPPEDGVTLGCSVLW